MPIYQYHCSSCDYQFSSRQEISNRKSPENDPCPGCSIHGFVSLVIGTPLVSYSTNPGLKTTDNFNARLQEISKNKGTGHSISTRQGGI